MRIFPAIDIKEGKCVRLRQGRAEEVTVYGDPIEMAQEFINQGAHWIHVVDLDGAFSGKSRNLAIIEKIADKPIKIQLGGGLRSMAAIEACMDAGVDRLILGTAAAEDVRLLQSAIERYTGRIAVGIDARDGQVATRGWVQQTDLTAMDLAIKVRDMGINTVIYTDISGSEKETSPPKISLNSRVSSIKYSPFTVYLYKKSVSPLKTYPGSGSLHPL